MVITEEELKKYYNYVLDIYNKSKNDLGEILNGNSRSKENRRNNKISILLKTNNESYINAVAEQKRKLGFIVEVFETFVTKTNLMGGKKFQERYDTPYYCSPSSESYWSM